MEITEGSKQKKTVMGKKIENELSLGRSKGEIWSDSLYFGVMCCLYVMYHDSRQLTLSLGRACLFVSG